MKLVLSTLVNLQYMAFKHCISFATCMALNFGCNWFRITPDIVSKLCSPPSEVAVLFYSNLSRLPFLGQDVDLDLLHFTGFNLEHTVLFLCHIFNQRSMTDRKIKRSHGCCFGLNNFSPIPLKFSFHMNTKSELLQS